MSVKGYNCMEYFLREPEGHSIKNVPYLFAVLAKESIYLLSSLRKPRFCLPFSIEMDFSSHDKILFPSSLLKIYILITECMIFQFHPTASSFCAAFPYFLP